MRPFLSTHLYIVAEAGAARTQRPTATASSVERPGRGARQVRHRAGCGVGSVMLQSIVRRRIVALVASCDNGKVIQDGRDVKRATARAIAHGSRGAHRATDADLRRTPERAARQNAPPTERAARQNVLARTRPRPNAPCLARAAF